jgi:hypothetical protein
MPLEYFWTRIGKPIPQKAYLKDLNRVLVIDNVQFEDEGSMVAGFTTICAISTYLH